MEMLSSPLHPSSERDYIPAVTRLGEKARLGGCGCGEGERARRGSADGWSAGALLADTGASSRVISITVAVIAIATNTMAAIRASTFPSIVSPPGLS